MKALYLVFAVILVVGFVLLKCEYDIVENKQSRSPSLRILKNLYTSFHIPTIYVVTPTYRRHVQKAELTRLSQTLMLVPNIHWIIVEDSANKTELVTNFVSRYMGRVTHLNAATPEDYKTTQNNYGTYPRGVLQRNKAILWLRTFATEGVVYFADDDNTYSLDIFEEMRYTEKVSVWPVGLVGGLMVERPLVIKDIVVGFNSVWAPERNFPLDMAAFALNLKLFFEYPNAYFSLSSRGGFQETDFITSFGIRREDLEPKAAQCTQVMVWHTRTEPPNLELEQYLISPSDFNIEV